jgi:metal-responsive CopG/Arc/MetJ family transcriptional regulator
MKKVITSLPEADLAALDRVRERQNLTRSQAVREAIRWYVGVMTKLPPAEDALPDEIKAIEEGQQQIARGEYIILENLKHDMAGPAKQ